MIKTQKKKAETVPDDAVFALDIGTRSIIGMVGIHENDRIHIVAIEQAEHTRRAMIDGQIENIEQVAAVAAKVKSKLEERLGIKLRRVCVAAAGRALKTQKASFEMELPGVQLIDEEIISQLEAGAISKAEEAFDMTEETGDMKRRFYLVGYTVFQYYLDNYLLSSLKDHHGQRLKADIIATFLPSEVVESLYTTMQKTGLEIASLTLEPIAAINAAIPENLRLLNLALVDIGAGTSDIAACRDGSIIGYTMATVAGDEITEAIMKEYLVDFQTAEHIKAELETNEELIFTDVLGFEHTADRSEILTCIEKTSSCLFKEISEKILEVNGGKPSAVFLAGGGSKLAGLREGITEHLGMDPKRVAIAGNNFKISAFSETYDLNNPEYATPLGITISAGLNLINDSFLVMLNGKPAKLFRTGAFTVRDILMMNSFTYQDMIGRSGQNVIVTINGKRTVFYGTSPEPAELLINRQTGKLSDIIHAGDVITFTPANHGDEARKFVGDIPGILPEANVTINGKPAPLETLLTNGDIVEFENPAVPEIMEADNPAKEEEEEEEDILEEYGTLEDPDIPEPDVQPVFVPDIKPEQRIQTPKDTITFRLNDKDLTLPFKKNGSPYYLMDMLEFSNLDFDNVSGQVVLEINGSPGSFRQVVKSGDSISIYEQVK